jgi:hypothetical protein
LRLHMISGSQFSPAGSETRPLRTSRASSHAHRSQATALAIESAGASSYRRGTACPAADPRKVRGRAPGTRAYLCEMRTVMRRARDRRPGRRTGSRHGQCEAELVAVGLGTAVEPARGYRDRREFRVKHGHFEEVEPEADDV